ncbi:periplasmic Cu-chaperone (thioredoxin-fold) [Sulfurimonas gotlandica GD1]|uniref:Periplasmic Cu-chaperone (Thioredoxin-fold) n=1 Tax=Sulfurimonas gotlandica (strain DSM 19862 / JCM 16533 / GD1) TaxID=929558 RepID=B6BJP0_SULGG|nr:SCO family protein [Sulfurimonas gotlandica]EDZ62652.1 SCO1/SenC superfamily [Sulfurimonas gotlandica GD1]EHP31286.1 periplasmic Cu-chaperone (thioredoxin-fold) [Sulfurimonas gotlandica GD1]
MKNKKYKIVTIVLLSIFFLMVPFIQSFIFVSNTKGKIEINKELEASYVKSDRKFILLFFGYVGCVDVCTPLLEKLNTMHESKEFEAVKEDVEVMFVNLTPEVEKHQPDNFAKVFNKDFKGVYLSRKETLSIDRTFGLFFSRSLSDKTELDHTDFLYLIENASNRQVLKNIYSVHPFNKEKITEDIKQLKVRKTEDLK